MTNHSSKPAEARRLKRIPFHILTALAGERLHGLGIVRDVLVQTDGSLKLWPAALYGALEQLADDGLIEEVTSAGERYSAADGGRRYFGLTSHGRQVLWSEVRRIEAETEIARGRLHLDRARTP